MKIGIEETTRKDGGLRLETLQNIYTWTLRCYTNLEANEDAGIFQGETETNDLPFGQLVSVDVPIHALLLNNQLELNIRRYIANQQKKRPFYKVASTFFLSRLFQTTDNERPLSDEVWPLRTRGIDKSSIQHAGHPERLLEVHPAVMLCTLQPILFEPGHGEKAEGPKNNKGILLQATFLQVEVKRR